MTRSCPSANTEALTLRGSPTVALAGRVPHSTVGRGRSITTRRVGVAPGMWAAAAARGRRERAAIREVANGHVSEGGEMRLAGGASMERQG